MTPSAATSHQSPTHHGPAFGAQEHEEGRDHYVVIPSILTVFSIFLITNSGMWTKSSGKKSMLRKKVPRKNPEAESRTETESSGIQPVPLLRPSRQVTGDREGMSPGKPIPPEHHPTQHLVLLFFMLQILRKSLLKPGHWVKGWRSKMNKRHPTKAPGLRG